MNADNRKLLMTMAMLSLVSLKVNNDAASASVALGSINYVFADFC